MKLKELLNTCQNQWLNAFRPNPIFTVTLLFEDKSENELEREYILKHNYCDDENYLTKYRDRIVKWWKANGINDLTIEVEGHY